MTESYDRPDFVDNNDEPETSSPPDQASPATTPLPRKTPLQNEIELKVAQAGNKITAADREMVAQMADPNYGSRRVMMTPPIASLILSEYNRHNRDVQYAKIRFLSNAMARGEWKWNHQGIAFYDDGMLGDGQHRCYACVLSGVTIPLQVTSALSKDAIDTVDNQSVRNAGDACQLLGIKDPKIKARVMESVALYEEDLAKNQVSGAKMTVIQVEKLVVQFDGQLDAAIAIARKIIETIATPHQTLPELAACALALLRGGYPSKDIARIALNVNMGIGDSNGSPTVELARMYEKANNRDNRKYYLSGRARLALFFKGAALEVQGKSVAKLKWEPGKGEKLPPTQFPIAAEDIAAE
jgi:hypothetical protein